MTVHFSQAELTGVIQHRPVDERPKQEDDQKIIRKDEVKEERGMETQCFAKTSEKKSDLFWFSRSSSGKGLNFFAFKLDFSSTG